MGRRPGEVSDLARSGAEQMAGVETKPAEPKDRVRCEGGDDEGVNQGKKKEVSYGMFSRMEWMRQQGLYERGFLNTTNHKEGERNISMFCKKLNPMITKTDMEAPGERRTNTHAHKKLLESARRGM